jgi:hypothetical protein
MKNFLLLILSFSTLLFSQSEIQVQDAKKSSLQTEWGIDNALLNNEPLGSFSGVQKSDGKLYVAVNDTLSTSNLGLVVFTSSNNGATWTLLGQGINYRGLYSKIKMIRSGLDSIYVSFQIVTDVYVWNPLSGNFGRVHAGNYRTYDIVASSTGNLYIFPDSLTNNNIMRYGSTNGGQSWINRGLITSSGAMPVVFMSGTGDTLTLNYYGPVLADTATSVVRGVRYRESGPGTLATAGSFADVITGTDYKKEFKTIMNNGECWLFYTLGPDGSRNIYARKSINNGTSYDPPILIAGNPLTDEYSFDAAFYAGTDLYGFDLIYYSDSAQVGPATNSTDILYHKSVSYGSTTFTASQRISENPPSYSPNYSTSILPMHYSASDVAALWVGNVGSTKKLFFDKFSAIIPVELVSFRSIVEGNKVTLSWTTATETNNYGFEVLRKQTNSEWEKIGFIAGAGNSVSHNTYSYTDNNLTPGIYSYRLKQIDYSGTYKNYDLTETVKIGVPERFELMQNYPNPFNPSTKISWQSPVSSWQTLKIYDVLGNEVAILVDEFREAGKYEVEFPVETRHASSLPSGVYFYSIKAGDYFEVKKMSLIK